VRVPDYEVLTARVSTRSTVEVRCILYSVPSRLIGQQIEIHLYHDRLVGYLGAHPVFEVPRLRVKGGEKRRGRCVNYRHVIEGLRRKPRAFLYCTWQQDLLPNAQFRSLWERLKAQFELDQAAVLLVEALYIAATQDKEQAVAEYLEQQLRAQTLSLQRLQQQFVTSPYENFPCQDIKQHPLASYDQLLPSNFPCPSPESVPEPQPTTQGPALIAHAYPLGVYRDPGYAGALVLCEILTGFVRRGNPASSSGAAPTDPQRSPTPRRKKFFQL
jgi:hypothetical protein